MQRNVLDDNYFSVDHSKKNFVSYSLFSLIFCLFSVEFLYLFPHYCFHCLISEEHKWEIQSEEHSQQRSGEQLVEDYAIVEVRHSRNMRRCRALS